MFNGTGANVTALTSLVPRWGAVVATSTAHIHSDEGGAPEKVAGLKLFTVDTPDGKLTPELIATAGVGLRRRAPRAAARRSSITQTTELGTLYTPAEIRAIADCAHANGMALHLDGARIWNAAAALGVPFREFTTDAGVDVLSFGGTKNGLLGAEAIVVLNPDRAAGLIRLRKTVHAAGQQDALQSAQLLALFDGGLGLRSAPATRTRWPRGCAARSTSWSPTGRSPGLSFSAADPGERRLRGAAERRRRPHPRALPLLRLGSRGRPGALDDARSTPPRPTSTGSSRRSARSSRASLGWHRGR